MWHITKLNWQERTAYIGSLAAMVVGLYLGQACDPAWLARAGSVVIVCGVLLGSSRKNDILHSKVKAFIEAHRIAEIQKLLSEITNPDGTEISTEQAKELEARIYGMAHDDVAVAMEERRRIFKVHEVVLVVVGTLVNGFGEWSLKLVLLALKSAT